MANIELRPCIVKGVRALFHQWSQSVLVIKHSPERKLEVEHEKIVSGSKIEDKDTEYLSITMGIVEFNDGRVAEVYPNEIRFTDVVQPPEMPQNGL